MVEPTGDGVARPIQYAKFRDDKNPTTGYSRELVSLDLDPKYYDDMHSQQPYKAGLLTFLDYFEHHAKARPNDPYLGTRP